MSDRSGIGPSHAERISAKSRGVHCGVTVAKAVIGSPAASNSASHRGEGGGAVSGSRCGGTAWNSWRRPRVSTITDRMLTSVGGGSFNVTIVTSVVARIAASGRGLERYQSTIAGGAPLASASHRRVSPFVVAIQRG